MNNWKKELKIIIENGCTDSTIYDFIDSHPSVSAKDIWMYDYYLNAPKACKGCRHFRDCSPITYCSRVVKMEDRFEELPSNAFNKGARVEFIPNCDAFCSGIVVEASNSEDYFCRVKFDSGDIKGKEQVILSSLLREVKK